MVSDPVFTGFCYSVEDYFNRQWFHALVSKAVSGPGLAFVKGRIQQKLKFDPFATRPCGIGGSRDIF